MEPEQDATMADAASVGVAGFRSASSSSSSSFSSSSGNSSSSSLSLAPDSAGSTESVMIPTLMQMCIDLLRPMQEELPNLDGVAGHVVLPILRGVSFEGLQRF